MTRQVAVGIEGVKSHCQTVVILEFEIISGYRVG